MSKGWKKFASLLLAAVMTLGPTASAFAQGPHAGPATDEERLAYAKAREENRLEYLNTDEMDIRRSDEVDSADFEAKAEEPLYSADDIVRVSIVLDKPATLSQGFETANLAANASAMSYRGSLRADQASVTAAIEKALDRQIDVKWNLTLAVNVISANVFYGDIPAIESVSGVKTVEIENRYEPDRAEVNTAVTSGSMTGASNAWSSGYTGAGSRIAIVDTGTSQDHMAFDPDALEYSYEQNAKAAGLSVDEYKAGLNLLDVKGIEALLPQLNANNTAAKHNLPSSAELYKNEKIPFAFNYIDGNTVTDHESDTQGGHGSHVSGIAAANRYVEQNGSFADAASTVGAVGMAPDAQILTMKVFGAGGGAYDSDYMAAIEDAIILGADSVNLSLGSANPGFSFAGTYQEVMDSLVSSGTVAAMSAGNSYAWDDNLEYTDGIYDTDTNLHTGGSPGTFINTIGVASANNIGAIGMPIIFDGTVPAFYTETDYSQPKISSVAGTYDYVYIDCAGETADYEAVNAELPLEGKVVVVNRGAISFYVKGNNLVPYKPAALVIANNQDGTLNMNLEGFIGNFPMVCMTLADANSVKAGAAKQTIGGYDVYTGKIEITDSISSAETTAREDATMSDFSSWGVPGSLLMKPEITAPGGNIWSVDGPNKEGGTPGGGNDLYTIMSGTSMAAPHIAGLSAVMGQYIRENDLVEAAKTASGKELTQRNLILSLMMSTATPMKNNGLYLPVVQVGSGLVDIAAATSAKSFILMNDDATISAADGKVKAELGQDAAREGKYEYSFTVNNLTDEILTYTFDTDIFTQDTDEGYLLHETKEVPATVTYDFPQSTNDVDKDGDVDFDDVQAILDVVTGLKSEADVDADAADVDGDGSITSLDAQLLLAYVTKYGPSKIDGETLSVPANGSVEVKVTITLDDVSALDRDGGAFIEGYTYVTPASATAEGAIEDAEHSIPILGYYGSWTDASMFDHNEDYDGLPSYFGLDNNAAVAYKLNGKTYTAMGGNPYSNYVGEDPKAEERAAISGAATFSSAAYLPIRNAASLFAMFMDEDGSVISSKSVGSNVIQAYYHVNNAVWRNNTTLNAPLNTAISSLGVSDGAKLQAGLLAVPEYYALMLNPQAKAGQISADEAAKLFADGEIGKGAFLGSTFTVDSQKPVIKSAELSKDFEQITVVVQDNLYVACLAVTDVSGKTFYLSLVPDQSAENEEITYTFNLSDIVDENGEPLDLGNGVAVFAGDYAGNSEAVFVRLGRGPVYSTEDVYVLTDTIVGGEEYLIVNTKEAGTGSALTAVSNYDSTTVDPVTIKLMEDGTPYIQTVNTASLWTAIEDNMFESSEFAGGYLGYSSSDKVVWTWPYAFFGDDFTYDAATSLMKEYRGYLTFDAAQNGFIYNRSGDPTPVYIYTKGDLTVEIDPENASEITVDPEEVTLFTVDGLDTVQILAEISPIVLADKTINWSSADESVATVDQTGLITAVAPGETTVTAASNQTPSVTAEVKVTVVDSTPFDAITFAQATIDGEPEFIGIDLNDMSQVYPLYDGQTELKGGGRSGSKIFGIDVDDYFIIYDLDDGFSATSPFDSAMNTDYGILDATAVPKAEYVVDEKTYTLAYDAIYAAPDYLLLMTEDGNLSGWNYSGLRGITFIGLDTDEETGVSSYYYYGFNENGEIVILFLEASLEDDGTVDLSLKNGTLGAVTGAGFKLSDDPYAYSLNYLGFNTYEDFADNSQEAVLLADRTNSSLWYISTDEDDENYLVAQFVGVIPDGSNLVCLFNNDIESIDSVTGSDNAAQYNASASVLRSADSAVMFDEGKAVQMISSVNVNSDPAVNKSVGGLNSFSGKIDETAEPEKIGQSPKTEFNLAEDQNTKNGYAIVTYDPEALEYLETTSEIAYYSVNDTEDGTIKFAYASVDEIPAGDYLATILFNAGCEDAGVTIETVERNEELGLSEISKSAVRGIGHDWGEPTYEWAADNSTVTAKAVCQNNNEHVLEETVNTTYEVITPATCEEDGEATFTATFTNELFETQTKTDVLKATGHKWGEPVWNWVKTDDGYTVTATFTCENDPTHVKDVEATVTSETTPANATEPGKTVYTATVTAPDGETTYTDTREDIIPATGYTYGEPVWTWTENEDGTVTAVATFTSNETEPQPSVIEVNATVTSVTTATCEDDGKTTYTGTVTFNGEEYEDTYEVETPATGHDWGDPVWKWNADFTAATATFTCKNDPSHVKTINAVITVTSLNGYTVYTATVTGPDGETYTDTVSLQNHTEPVKPDPNKPDPNLPSIIPPPTGVLVPIQDNRPGREPIISIPGQPVKGNETPAIPAVINDLPFIDVNLSDSFYGDVKYVYENGIMNGISATEFAPNSTLTRAMVVTILYRVEGTPVVEFKGTFTDVEAGQWYSEAVEWAAANGIVNGYGNGKFGPMDAVTLEQLAAILNRYADFKDYAVSEGAAVTGTVSDWAVANVNWAVANDILATVGNYTVPALRSEVATAIHAFCVNVAK